MAGSQWPNQTHAPNPSPTIPHGHGFEWWGDSHSTCQQMPQPKLNPSPTIPHGLRGTSLLYIHNKSYCCKYEASPLDKSTCLLEERFQIQTS
ncbi:hypothetical protein HanIR_Chr10g0479271 [Helianthus annuus]|nr:hypothetical protein HanIR_Chr10g0479271 [Helianthus annuus]